VVGAGVDEEEEVVPDELHPVDGLLDRHPLGIEVLRADDDGRVLLVGIALADDRDLAGCDRAQHIDRGRLQIDARERAAALVELGPRGWLRASTRLSFARRSCSASLSTARSRATNLSPSVASARTTGPLPVTVSSTVSSSREPLWYARW
jgi:hypothetical protein